MTEAAPEFKQLLQEAFQAVQVGRTFTFRRTFTDGDVALFCGVTGDYNPYHLDDAFARETWFGRRNIPGLLTASLLRQGGQLAHKAYARYRAARPAPSASTTFAIPWSRS
jgi:3-hydroxybutyryl-CoA dehydratase